MADNLGLNSYTVGGDYDTWGDKLISDLDDINSALGDVETFSNTSGTITLTQAQSNKPVHQFTGSLTGNLTVDTLASKGGAWFVQNNTFNSFTLTYQVTGGAGASVTVDQGKNALVISDGQHCRILDLATISSQLGTAQITDAAVTTAKIADSNVTTAKIADANITTAKIADANVTAAKIASDAVTTAKILDANITTAKIAANAVTFAKLPSISDNRILGNVSGGAAVPAEITLQNDDTFASASASTLATSLSIKNYVINTAFSSALPLQTGNQNKWVTTDGTNASWSNPEFLSNIFKINDNSDPTKQVSFNVSGITTGSVRDLTVPDSAGTLLLQETLNTYINTRSDLGASVSTSNDKLAIIDASDSNAIKTINPEDIFYPYFNGLVDLGSSVSTSADKIPLIDASASDVKFINPEDIFYPYINGLADLGTGVDLSSDRIPILDASDSSIKYVNPEDIGSGGSLVQVGSKQNISGSPTYLEFTSGIDSTYEEYLIKLYNIQCNTDNSDFRMWSSTNGGGAYDTGGSDYQFGLRGIIEDGTTFSQTGTEAFITLGEGMGNDTNENGWSGEIRLIRPSEAQYGEFLIQGRFPSAAGGAARSLFGSATRRTAADIDALRFGFSSGTISSGVGVLYGVKSS